MNPTDYICTQQIIYVPDILYMYLPADVCPYIPPPLNGSMSTTLSVVRTKLNITCHTGYMFPSGTEKIQTECLEGGEWLHNHTIQDCIGNVKLLHNHTEYVTDSHITSIM